MRYFTKEWYAKLQQFSTDGSSQKEAQSVLDVYSKIFAKNFKNDPPFMPHIRTFHDCDLIEAFWRKDDYIIKLDCAELGKDEVVEVIFTKAVVSLIEFNDQELCWGYSELYPVKYGYEFHCQFAEYGSNDRYDLILCCKDIKTVYSINI